MEDFWSENFALRDLLLSSDLTLAEIAKELGVSQSALSKGIKEVGLDWAKRKSRKMSRGEYALTNILKRILPNENITNEFQVGERLRIDVYCPRYKVGIEYHGRQHFNHVPFFHETYEDFIRAQERDERKIELCKEQGITLIIFKYNDSLSEEIVYDRILDALREDTTCSASNKLNKKRTNRSVVGTPQYKEMKARKSEFGKEMRKKMKERRNAGDERIY